MEQFAAVAGFDWAAEKHDYALAIPGKKVRERGTIKHSAEAIRQWVEKTHERCGGQIAVCLEQSRGALYYALSEYRVLSLFPINPATLARYRQAFYPSGAKDDPSDACLQRELVERLRDKLKLSGPRDAASDELDLYTRYRRAAVDEGTRLAQQLRAHLANYFSAFLEVFDDLGTDVVCDFLLTWPELNSVQGATDEELYAFFRAHHIRKALAVSRVARFREALPLTTNRCVIEPSIVAVKGICRQRKAVNESIREFEKILKRLVAVHPDANIFCSFPAMGCVHAARIMAFFGEDRTRFRAAIDVQTASGIAPVLIRSGKTTVVKSRVACNHFYRQSFVEWAGGTIPVCGWAKAFYAEQRRRGKDHHVAVRSLAYKWIRILYVCWKNKTRYCEDSYLKKIAALS